MGRHLSPGNNAPKFHFVNTIKENFPHWYLENGASYSENEPENRPPLEIHFIQWIMSSSMSLVAGSWRLKDTHNLDYLPCPLLHIRAGPYLGTRPPLCKNLPAAPRHPIKKSHKKRRTLNYFIYLQKHFSKSFALTYTFSNSYVPIHI